MTIICVNAADRRSRAVTNTFDASVYFDERSLGTKKNTIHCLDGVDSVVRLTIIREL